MTDLEIIVQQRPGFHLVGLAGDLDRQCHLRLLQTFDQLLADPRPRVVVDTTALTFCDSHGLHVLVRGQRRAEDRGGVLRLVGVRGTLATLLTTTQLVDLFPPYASLAQASRWPAVN
jgi:anti-sigma B factor antagonist